MVSKYGFERQVWDAVYAAGEQLNRYPADAVVSFTHKLMSGRERQGVRVLEIGCGAGNNAWFFSREGFAYTGIDGSSHALDYARKRLDAEGLPARLLQMDFLSLGGLDGQYDFILDRSALYANHWNDLVRIMPMIAGLMAPDARFLSFIFTTDHPDKRYMARSEENATWLDPCCEAFGGVQRATLLDREHLEALYAPFTILDLYKRTLESLVHDAPHHGDSEWIVVAGPGRDAGVK